MSKLVMWWWRKQMKKQWKPPCAHITWTQCSWTCLCVKQLGTSTACYATGPFRSFRLVWHKPWEPPQNPALYTSQVQHNYYVRNQTQDTCQNRHPWKVNTLQWPHVHYLTAMSTCREPRHHKPKSSFYKTVHTDSLHEVHDNLSTLLRIWQRHAGC